MFDQLPMKHSGQDAETLEEAYEAQRINSLPLTLQGLVLAHHQDQFNSVPSYQGQQASDFVAFCDALGISSIKDQ